MTSVTVAKARLVSGGPFGGPPVAMATLVAWPLATSAVVLL